MIRSGFSQTVRRWFPLYLSVLFLVLIATGLEARAQTVDSVESAMFDLINQYRAQNGLQPLKLSAALTRSSEWMSADMAAKNYFAHNDSQGRDPFVRMAAFGYNYNTNKGENLAAGYDDAVRTFNQWKTSPGHNANMLNGTYAAIGIARAYNGSSTYKWYWTTDFGGYVDATIGGGAPTTQTVRTVNAGNYFQTVSPDSIVSTFGDQFTPATASASSVPLPTSLGGVTVTVNDIAAQILFVSPAQVNYIVPSNVGTGTAMVKVSYNGALLGTGTVAVDNVSPSAFTTSANGQGVAAALTTFDGATYQPVSNTNGTARSVSVGTASRPNYLVLYGTGMRRRSSMSAVSVNIGGVVVPADYLGAHPRLMGVDQLNVKMPQSLRGRGNVNVTITIDGRVSNVSTLNIGN
jgi:uncharacterized protein (TIGR03437 family)